MQGEWGKNRRRLSGNIFPQCGCYMESCRGGGRGMFKLVWTVVLDHLGQRSRFCAVLSRYYALPFKLVPFSLCCPSSFFQAPCFISTMFNLQSSPQDDMILTFGKHWTVWKKLPFTTNFWPFGSLDLPIVILSNPMRSYLLLFICRTFHLQFETKNQILHPPYQYSNFQKTC